jgi:mannose-6-phosphate isomerase-like protein (cupin superfamily)
MRYLRSFSDVTPQPGVFDSQFLAAWESCGLLRSVVPPGKEGFRLHMHPVDQFYYILEGEMQVQIGNQTYSAKKDTLVHLPAGIPHHNWNTGSVDEVHLEIFAPMPSPLVPIVTPVEESEITPPANCIRPLDQEAWEQPLKGSDISLQWLARRSNGSEHLMLNVMRVPPGSGGPKLHTHTFDQFYFVLSGEMTVQLGLEQHKLKRYDLALIPAGVPHCQWNEGPEPESHITMNIPEPDADISRWDLPVDFAVKGSAK